MPPFIPNLQVLLLHVKLLKLGLEKSHFIVQGLQLNVIAAMFAIKYLALYDCRGNFGFDLLTLKI